MGYLEAKCYNLMRLDKTAILSNQYQNTFNGGESTMADNNTTTILKTCTKCKETKSISEFHKSSKDDYHTRCKECVSEYSKQHYVLNKAKKAEYERLCKQRKWEMRGGKPQPTRIEGATQKVCTKCKVLKDLADFNISKRNIDNRRSDCKQCEYAQKRAWVIKNRERLNIKRRNRANSIEQKQKIAERVKKWKKLHPDKKKAYQVQRRSKIKNLITDLTTSQWDEIKSFYNYCCAYCGKETKLTIDHVIPIAKGGHHTANNVVPACLSCNSSKGVKMVQPSVMHNIFSSYLPASPANAGNE